MLTLAGKFRSGYCDGVSRRDFLRIGGLALGGLSLPQLLETEAQAGVGRSHKAVIMVFLAGGPPHMDMVDLKPQCSRGHPWRVQANRHKRPRARHLRVHAAPRAMMDKFTVIRSLVGNGPDHSGGQALTGYTDLISKASGGRPSLGRWCRSCKARCIRTFRRSSACRRAPARFVGESGRSGLSWDWPTSPFTPFRTEAEDGTERKRKLGSAHRVRASTNGF